MQNDTSDTQTTVRGKQMTLDHYDNEQVTWDEVGERCQN